MDAKNGAGSVEFGGKGEHKFPQKQLIYLNYFFLKEYLASQFPCTIENELFKLLNFKKLKKTSLLPTIQKINTTKTFFAAKPNVTLTLKDGDLVDLMTGKLNAQKAFFQGKLKIQGNMGLALKLQEFQKQAGDVMKAKL